MTEATLRKLFDGKQVVASAKGARNAVLPLTDFHPPLLPDDVTTVCAAMDAAVKDWSGVTALVGLADRGSGPLTHGVALLRNLPYSLANWYPAGSIGDIVVENSGGFTGNAGVVFFNGLKKGDKVVFIDDVVRRGKSSSTLLGALTKAGVVVVQAVFAADVEGRGGLARLRKEGIEATSLCTLDVSEDTSRVLRFSSAISAARPYPRSATVADIKRMSKADMIPKFRNVLNSFVGIKIYRADNSDYPYCNFALTDFTPLLQPSLVEDMADCMSWLGDFYNANIIVSESDRGGGPLSLAMSRRTGLPFTMANWSQSPHTVGVAAAAQVGYSGHGQLFLNGIKRSSRCLVVDDMLSSGGTAEGLFHAIEAAGGQVVEAHFASEKVTTGGRARLQTQWPSVALYSVCFFEAGGSATKEATPLYGSNESPIQAVAPFDAKVGMASKILHRALLATIVYLYITQRA